MFCERTWLPIVPEGRRHKLFDRIGRNPAITIWVRPAWWPARNEKAARACWSGGPKAYSSIEHPGRVRFLHRDPPSYEFALGTSCFSKTPYGLRQWQHIVAVKDGPEMRLYINGEVAASAEDNTPLSDGLELLVGQLDRERDWRPFVGQLDELAFYDRALSDPEIQRHYHLVRPIRALRRGI
jgi:hypothetical protein